MAKRPMASARGRRARAGRVPAAVHGGVPAARPLPLPQPHVLVRHQVGDGPAPDRARPGLPHRPRHAGRQRDLARLELRRHLPHQGHHEDARAGRARPRALPAHEGAARAHLLDGRAARVRAAALRAGAQRVRHPLRARLARLHHGRARAARAQGALARPGRVLPEGRQCLQIQAAGVLAGRAAGRHGEGRQDPRPRRLPAATIQHQEESLRILVRHEARGLGAAHDHQGRHHGLPLAGNYPLHFGRNIFRL